MAALEMPDMLDLHSKLPDFVLEKSIGFQGIESNENLEGNRTVDYLRSRLPASDIKEIAEAIRKNFPLAKEKQVFQKRWRPRGCPKAPYLSNTRKRELGIFDISKKGLKFKDLLPIHLCWVNYMEDYLDLPHIESLKLEEYYNREELTTLLWKADYHGAYIVVKKAKCPSYIGIEGILVFETKGTLKLLGRDDTVRTVPKEPCEFQLKIGKFYLTFLGKNLLVRPAERSKKMKGCQFFEL